MLVADQRIGQVRVRVSARGAGGALIVLRHAVLIECLVGVQLWTWIDVPGVLRAKQLPTYLHLPVANLLPIKWNSPNKAEMVALPVVVGFGTVASIVAARRIEPAFRDEQSTS
jgi:hypothetical protein